MPTEEFSIEESKYLLIDLIEWSERLVITLIENGNKNLDSRKLLHRAFRAPASEAAIEYLQTSKDRIDWRRNILNSNDLDLLETGLSGKQLKLKLISVKIYLESFNAQASRHKDCQVLLPPLPPSITSATRLNPKKSESYWNTIKKFGVRSILIDLLKIIDIPLESAGTKGFTLHALIEIKKFLETALTAK